MSDQNGHPMAYSDPKEPGVVRVMIAIPNLGHTQPESYCNRLMNFMHLGRLEQLGLDSQAPHRVEFRFAVLGRIFTPVARDEACRMTLNSNCDFLLMIDDDMICPDNMFEQLYARDVDVIAPLAFTRNAPYKPVLYSIVEGYDHTVNKDYFINNVVMNYPKDQLVECDAVGFGAVLIKRWVIEKMAQPWFMSTCGTGEDIFFCHKARKIGARVFMDTACKLGHLSHPLCIDEPYVEDYRKTADPTFQKRAPVPIPTEAQLVLGE